MTPHEALYGEKPCVQNLKIFAYDAYAHVPKDERSKLDVKAQKCVLLACGTETKSYRLLNQEMANHSIAEMLSSMNQA